MEYVQSLPLNLHWTHHFSGVNGLEQDGTLTELALFTVTCLIIGTYKRAILTGELIG